MCMRLELNQTKNGLLSLIGASMKSVVALRNSSSTVSMRFLVERARVLAFLLAPGPEARILARRVGRGGDAFQDAARTELRLETRVLRIVGVLRLLLGVEVIEIAEEFVEAVHGRQELVAVAEMVLAELAGDVALRLQQLGDGRVLVRQPLLGAPGSPTFRRPVRIGLWPVMKAARPAVQDCWP